MLTKEKLLSKDDREPIQKMANGGGIVGTLSTAGAKYYSGGQDAFTGDFFVLVEVIDDVQDYRKLS
jgi:hypothetical protein